jgi:uncharacterized protein involved in exopolysaccharide biosynthesis
MRSLQIRPADIIKAFWRDKWIVVGVILLAGVASVAYALTRVPVYTSEALLASPEEENSGLGALSGMLGNVSSLTGVLGLPTIGGTSVEEVAAVLKSRDFSLRFIRNHDLMPHLFPDKKWPKSSADASGVPVEKMAPVTGASLGLVGSDGSRAMTVEDVLDKFALMRLVSVDRRTSFVTIRVRARQPDGAQNIAKAMVEDINAELRGRALVETRLAESFLNEKIASAQFESIRNTAAALLESQLKRQVVAESRPDFALRVLDPPSLPEMRSYPRRSRMVIIGGLLGCLVAGVIVLFRLRRRVSKSLSVAG